MKWVAPGALLLAAGARGQTQRFCEGELGEVGWDCASVSPLPSQVSDEAQKTDTRYELWGEGGTG